MSASTGPRSLSPGLPAPREEAPSVLHADSLTIQHIGEQIIERIDQAAPDDEQERQKERDAAAPTPRDIAHNSRAALHRYRRWALVADASAAGLAAAAVVVLRFGLDGQGWYSFAPFLVPPLWVVIVAAQRAYEARFLGAGPEEFRRVINAGLVLFTTIAVLSYSVGGDVSRVVVLVGVPLTVFSSLLFRRGLRRSLYRQRAAGRGMHRVLVVGRKSEAAGLIDQLDAHPEDGLLPIGACIPEIDLRSPTTGEIPVLGTTANVLQIVDDSGADTVALVPHPGLSGQDLRRLSWALEKRDVDLVVSPGIVEVAGPRLSIRPVAGLSLLHMERPSATGGRFLVKGAFDRILGAALLLCAAPVIIAIAAAVRMTSPGPVLFRQTRVGVDGREFTMLKFRSMVAGAEALRQALEELNEADGVLFKVKRDPRMTTVGSWLRRFSLDELPQLINVVRGDMSLVGPRPPLPKEVATYSDDAIRRLRVRPGMTGLWQVSGRADLAWDESLRLDLRYVDNWSLAMDLIIMWRTLRAVVHGTGAY